MTDRTTDPAPGEEEAPVVPCTVVGRIDPQLIWHRLAGEGRGPYLHSRLSLQGTSTPQGEA